MSWNRLCSAIHVLVLSGMPLLTGFTSASAQWGQLGQDIDGEAMHDQAGAVSLSADGSSLAIGANYNSGGFPAAGHVRVYGWSGTGWSQKGADIDGEASFDRSGWSVSLSTDGSRLAVGAPFNSGAGSEAGHVRIYSWNGTAWSQMGSDIDGKSAGSASGYAVSLSADGSRIAIGAPHYGGLLGVLGVGPSYVRVYGWTGAAWSQVGADIDGEAPGDLSGGSVSLSADGSRLAIGASGNDGAGDRAGHVRVYDWTGAAWRQAGADIDGEASLDGSGKSVSLSADGNRLAIGAPFNDGAGIAAGHVRIYSWNGTAWSQMGLDIDGEAAGDNSGSVSLSADGNRVAIGAPRNGVPATDAGHVRVHAWSGTAWAQMGLDIDGETAGDLSGSSVSLSADASLLAIGAWRNGGAGTNAGHVRVYEGPGPGIAGSGCPNEAAPVAFGSASSSLGFTITCPTLTQTCDTAPVVMFGSCAAVPVPVPPPIGCGVCGLIVFPAFGSIPSPWAVALGLPIGATFCVQCGCIANGFSCIGLSAGAQIVVVP